MNKGLETCLPRRRHAHWQLAVEAEVELQRRTAEQRTRFEQAVFRVHTYVTERKITPPECFISYAWGVPEHERWVEKRLATDLQKAGIGVVLDRWHNAQIGARVSRFLERIEKSDRIVMVAHRFTVGSTRTRTPALATSWRRRWI